MPPSTADTAAEAPAPPPPRLTLLSLPDELLAQIFRHLHAEYRRKTLGIPPLDVLLISKRLHAIAQPIWFSTLVEPENAKRSERFYAGMITHTALLGHVHDLQISLEPVYPAWKIAVFSHFVGLKTLRLRQLGEQEPRTLSLPNQDLARVKSLCLLSQAIRFNFPCRSVVQSLDMPASARTSSSLSTLRVLTLRIDRDVSLCDLPWACLIRLEIVVQPEIIAIPMRVLQDLLIQTAAEDAFASLRELKIVLTEASAAQREICAKLLACFSRTTPTKVELEVGDLTEAVMSFSWNSLKHLTLRSRTDMTQSYAFSRFALYLEELTTLSSLTLVDFNWDGSDDRSLSELEAPAGPWDFRALPSLYTFIHILRDHTQILHLQVRDTLWREWQWNRLSASNDFQADSYDLDSPF
ncbi:hypothetical protein JCM10908_006337 [Rhodotorula pacifica]|uniref:uncharacterized protein n=1 Tax=Rhodotorula pacifica TaxID=1495444 RepID=UPI00317009C8